MKWRGDFKKKASQTLIKAVTALMSLHIFFNIITFLGAPQKSGDSPTSPIHKFSCGTPAPQPSVQLEVFSALGLSPEKNPFAGNKPAPAPCPEAPQPLT